ncbi:uncharacterized protein LOC106152641 isoform X3 [Lingula anatina]|uniref:Uncharacterized protein LOC106152641 isoform X3 n=1 Tax=Lingula anatina TaxID=7574 RepID=A0A1S3H8F6_LINAN|nr:uncharacterized protein LOC106152641 isoform X3 [Lingula anatina]XP_013381765.1 uncharacterized protein LOC106152641 isoform X3 [Lingula anatina]XP_013381766.1 uncharacterized protein LOC106152641 isoform X3 [Lingula anatina]XP_013381767.1 uncharacterized protein LOC106152641 isoform X3 [Lingula anatina]XP_023930614.1 uncharacterized protein LOC106152641 isoform X3 [Lingula anatina]|eukprot:XP_013381764.1 uncharacterized protein LOC106152641 isoform X3 [Lingula anatina]
MKGRKLLICLIMVIALWKNTEAVKTDSSDSDVDHETAQGSARDSSNENARNKPSISRGKYPPGFTLDDRPGKVRRVMVSRLESAVEGQYLVKVLNNVTNREVIRALASAGIRRPRRFKFGIRRTSNLILLKKISEDQIRTLQENTDVFEIIEPDLITTVTQCTSYSTSGDLSWGLDRLDSPVNEDSFDNKLKMSSSGTGAGVDAYVVDTGINKDHEDFGGRVTYGYSITSTAADDNGHGTHVAGILGGTKYGVAKGANIIAVKVIRSDGSGTSSDFLGGLEWIQKQVSAAQRKSVVNVSLRWPHSKAVNSAVAGLVDSGIVMVVAAGNDGSDACEYSPGSEEEALCVGGTNWFDQAVPEYNNGPCVDIYAPAVFIESDANWANNATEEKSGTSMACPFVAGAAASYLSEVSETVPSMELVQKAKNKIFENAANIVTFNGISTDQKSDYNRLLQLKC